MIHVANKTYYADLVCSKTKHSYAINEIQTYSDAHKPLLAQYDLSATWDRNSLKGRPLNMWRYREVLPIERDEHIVSLGEGMTPLQKLSFGETQFGIELYVKNEAMNPTGSFKARGLSMAISKAKEFGIQKCVIPTAGNAGGAMSAYCAKAGMEAHVYMPKATPQAFIKECQFLGANLTLVDGNIKDCAQLIAAQDQDWFDVSTLKEPFRLEGKKTMGYEIAEQLQWEVPDVVVYPTGGGTGLIGIWKAFGEMEKLGWIGAKRPRMVAVQTDVCDPIVRAFHQKETIAKPYQNPNWTVANGLRVPTAFGDELILTVLNKSQGTAISISDKQILDGTNQVAQLEGILLAPEGAAVWMATQQLLQTGWIKPREKVVMLNTGSIYKYMENL